MNKVETDLHSKAQVINVYVMFSPAERVRFSFPSHHSSILLLLRALIILQSHAGLVWGTCFNLLRQLGSTCFSLEKLFRVVPLQWNSGKDKAQAVLWFASNKHPYLSTETSSKSSNWTYVYVDKLLSYVDKTPYFSSLYLNISLGSHPFDWCKHTGGKRKKLHKLDHSMTYTFTFSLSNKHKLFFFEIIKRVMIRLSSLNANSIKTTITKQSTYMNLIIVS